MSVPLVSELAARLNDLAGVASGLAGIQEAIQFVIDNHLEDWEVPITEEEQTTFLRTLTGTTVTLRTNLNCYPLGATTTVLFDEDGNLLP